MIRKPHNAGLQLRRAISIQAEEKRLLERSMLSHRQLQGFVRLRVIETSRFYLFPYGTVSASAGK